MSVELMTAKDVRRMFAATDAVALSPAGIALREINRHKLREFGLSRRQRAELGHAEAEAIADAGGEVEHFDGRA